MAGSKQAEAKRRPVDVVRNEQRVLWAVMSVYNDETR